jgi:hypothetical protein
MTNLHETEDLIRPASSGPRTSMYRRLMVAAIVLAIGGFLLQPAGALAAGPSSGEHYPEATITADGPSSYWWCRSWLCP